MRYLQITKLIFVGYLLYSILTRPCLSRHKSICETICCLYEEFQVMLCSYIKCLIAKICECYEKVCYKKICCESVKSKHKLKKCLEEFVKKIIIDNGPVASSITVLNNRSTDYNILVSDEIVEISNTADINVNLLPAPAYKGRELVVVKTSLNTFKINIVPNGSDLIDGMVSNIYLNDQFQRITLLSNGTNIYYIL